MDFMNEAILYSAGAVLVLQQILKLRVVPVALANKYPVITNIVLSAVAAIITVWQTGIDAGNMNAADWLVMVGTISVAAAIAYNNTFRNSDLIKSFEGTGPADGK